MNVQVSPRIAEVYPGACFGFLQVESASNPALAPQLEAQKAALTAALRARYPDAAAIQADPVFQAYSAYYKRFKKSYHVAQQVESVALKGRSIPSVAALVECMFMAELENGLLTAGHDLSALQGDVQVGLASGEETYTLLRGVEQVTKPDDLYMRDGQGIISSIIYGPDARTPITAATTAALYTVYAPPGVGAQRVEAHLARIREYVSLFCPTARWASFRAT